MTTGKIKCFECGGQSEGNTFEITCNKVNAGIEKGLKTVFSERVAKSPITKAAIFAGAFVLFNIAHQAGLNAGGQLGAIPAGIGLLGKSGVLYGTLSLVVSSDMYKRFKSASLNTAEKTARMVNRFQKARRATYTEKGADGKTVTKHLSPMDIMKVTLGRGPHR